MAVPERVTQENGQLDQQGTRLDLRQHVVQNRPVFEKHNIGEQHRDRHCNRSRPSPRNGCDAGGRYAQNAEKRPIEVMALRQPAGSSVIDVFKRQASDQARR